MSDSSDSFFEEDYEESENKDSIPLPPKNLKMPEFVNSESGIFVPPMLDSIDISDFESDDDGCSIPENPEKIPLFNLPQNLITDNSPCSLKKNLGPSIGGYKSILTIPALEQEKTQDISKQKPADQYFTEEYAIAFSLPLNSTKEQILNKIKKYSIYLFAKNNFRKHHLPTFNMRYYSIEEVTSYSDKPLYKMLLKSLPDTKKELGKAISIIILKYAKVIKSDNIDTLPIALVSALRENNEAIDETFFQLIKYSNNCPDRNVLAQIWKLWLIIGSLFPVSENYRSYIFAFLLRIIYKCDDPLGDIPQSQSAAVIHTGNKNVTHSQYESNDDIKNIEPAGNSIYKTDITFTNFAKFVFMRMFERTYKIGLIHNKDVTKEAFINMPKVVRLGRSMFSCSLYEVMWCQKRFYPYLPIPLPLYLIITQIKKNGGFLAPEFLVLKNRPESKAIMNSWIEKLPFDNTVLNDGEINELVAILFYFLYNNTDSVIPKLSADMFIEKCQSKNYKDIFGALPTLHLNTLKYIIGFLQDTLSFEQYNKMSKEQIAEIFSKFFVETHKKIIEPFKRFKMNELCNGFIIYCIDNLDCNDIYHLSPECTKRVEVKPKKQQTSPNEEETNKNTPDKKEEENKSNDEQKNKSSDEHKDKNSHEHKHKRKQSSAHKKKIKDEQKSENNDEQKNKNSDEQKSKSNSEHKHKQSDTHKKKISDNKEKHKTKDKHKDKRKSNDADKHKDKNKGKNKSKETNDDDDS